ncbi:F-box/FBD/LRR-repeat protein At1g13570-like [Telopea speciosissima]|uniref:F-box/FBD/LRR-repeat protein At1g13570-like n=1 Tax=Telopea speciosissima TaxID=54955 RepID=UPI001CC52ACA|nr:F-box/FBD/LRR-repeat protein At1g13570-like [Telopea speciosissima]
MTSQKHHHHTEVKYMVSTTLDRISDLPWNAMHNILGRLPMEEAVKTSILSRKWRNKWQCLLDRISDLPWNVIDTILVCLPIEEAVKTSILSKKWRNKWCSLSILHFQYDHRYDHLLGTSEDRIVLTNNLVKIVDHVLLLHQGQVSRFFLELPQPHNIDPWINSLSKKGLTELILILAYKRNPAPLIELCPGLFLCSQLNKLQLIGSWVFEPPLSFRGFTCLTFLCLYNVIISDGDLDKLFHSCPLLENFRSIQSFGFTALRVVSPRLKSFKYREMGQPGVQDKRLVISFENNPISRP